MIGPAMVYSRRQVLALGAAAVLVVPSRRTRGPAGSAVELAGDPFTVGVTSGDPDGSSAVLWTRLTAPDGRPLDADDVVVTWEVAGDDSFAEVVATGDVTARAVEGHSVHVMAPLDGPSWYRFRAGAWTSPVGRTAPIPADPTALTIAAASCQHFETGFYAAHRDIAEWQPDLVVFLGDFIYEYDANPVGGVNVRSHEHPEVRSLDDYRTRYATYLADPDLAASRSVAPWLTIWDDHEVENNYASLTPEDPAEAGEFGLRRLAAYQAWWEHMPVRTARPETGDDLSIYRTLSWGDLAQVILLDGRQYRTDQACGDVTLSFDPPCPEVADPARTMLGTDQEAWLAAQLAGAGARWTVIGQQTIVSDLRLPNGAIINFDQWDGYPAARDRLLLAAAQTERAVILTGDIHLAAVARLPGIGAEFVTTSISSLPPALPEGFDASVSLLFPDLIGAEFTHRGYVRHTVSAAEWIAQYRVVDDATDPASGVSTWRTFGLDASAPDVVIER